MRIAVVGGGPGGLAAAARLARAGLDVTVFEQNPAVGEKAAELRLGGCRFGTGPSLLTMPHVLDNLFADLGERREAHLDLRPVDVLCRYEFADGTVLRSCPDTSTFAGRLATATTDTAEAVDRYMARSATLYRLAEGFFLHRPLAALPWPRACGPCASCPVWASGRRCTASTSGTSETPARFSSSTATPPTQALTHTAARPPWP